MGKTESGLKDDWLFLNEEITEYWCIKERSHLECFDNQHRLKHTHMLSPAKFSVVKLFNSEVPIP